MSTNVLRVGMVGYAFMGAVHAHAWRNAHRFFDLPLTPELTAIAGRSKEAVNAAADRLGFASLETDWHALVERDDVDLIDICTPGDSHAAIAVAALQAGKHVLCEKPLANTVEEAEQMAAAAKAAAERNVWAMCGFTYRRTPALALARGLVEAGRIGTVRQVRAQYLQDWLHDPDAPMTWRLEKAKSGSGALGDLGAHLVDTTQWLTGQPITGVSAILETFVTSRPLSGEPSGLGGHGDTGADSPRGEVTVDDAALFTARFADGSIATFEATRFALGRKNALRIEINGTDGSIAFDFEENNVLRFFDGTEPVEEQGFRRILVTEPEHPYVSAWWPPGHGLGYEHGFTHQVADLVNAIAENRQPAPSFDDGLQVQRVLSAVEDSAAHNSSWTEIS
ncbi:MAG: Gfo/Idh/MocA family protein [Propionibacteriaceae bacterium]|jgi:predicted dehydrogenase